MRMILPLFLLLAGCHQIKEVPLMQQHSSGEISVDVLALPLHTKSDFSFLKSFIEKRYPNYELVLVSASEKLLNKGAQDTHLNLVPRGSNERGLRLWLIRKST